MNKPLRWGVLGAAKIARDQLCPAIHQAARGQLVALATRDSARAAPFVAQYPGLRVHDNYNALLDDPEIDAIYIPLPNDMHIPWSVRAIEAGKHVLCEKPMALRADQFDALIDLRDRAGLVVAEAFMVLHHPQWARLRALLAGGEIGALGHVEGIFAYNNANDPGNIRNLAAHGGGALLDIGVYPLVTTRFATGGEPVEVSARMILENGVDTTTRAGLDFAGFSLDMMVSMRLGLRQSMVFHGTDGWIGVAAPFNPGDYGEAQLQIHGRDGSLRVERFGVAPQYQLMIEAFNRAALDGVPFPVPLEFSRGNQRAIDAIFAAAKTT